MDVVTYLSAALLLTASLSVLFLVGRHLVRQQRERAEHDAIREQGLVGASAAQAGIRPGLASGMASGMASSGMPHLPLTDGLAAEPPPVGEFLRQFEPIESDLHVYSRLALFGPAAAPIVVHNGGVLLMYGTAASQVTVRKGGTLWLYGTLVGDVLNEGGALQIVGTVVGRVLTRDGQTVVHPIARLAHAPQ